MRGDRINDCPLETPVKRMRWVENLLSFLAAPKAFAKGTSMAFPGFKKEKDRADCVAYLNTCK